MTELHVLIISWIVKNQVPSRCRFFHAVRHAFLWQMRPISRVWFVRKLCIVFPEKQQTAPPVSIIAYHTGAKAALHRVTLLPLL